MERVATWGMPTTVRFGAGRIAELADACAAAGVARPLLVTDRGLEDSGIVAAARSRLDGHGFFAGVSANPRDADLAAGIAAYRDGGHDGVVAMGGGSALDLGKLIAFQHGQSRAVWDFEDVGDFWTRADADAIAPVVAVPTTAGTGSEVGRAAVLTRTPDRVKKVIFHPRMLPAQVIADPELTVGLPRAMTTGTGIDAFAHCLEAYCAPAYHPVCAGVALEGMRLVKEALPRATADPRDLDARADMMAAAMAGAIAFQRGLGAIHALSHPIGAIHDTHHGTTNAAVMLAVLDWNRPAIEEPIARAAAYLGLAPGFDAFADWLAGFLSELSLPSRLSELGIERTSFDAVARMAPDDPTAGGNPRPVTQEAARALLDAAW